MAWQLMAASEDGHTRLPERYATREEAEAEAKRRHHAADMRVREYGGEWFQSTFYSVVEAR